MSRVRDKFVKDFEWAVKPLRHNLKHFDPLPPSSFKSPHSSAQGPPKSHSGEYPSTVPTPSSEPLNDRSVRLLALELHNQLRRSHKVLPLELSDELCKQAQAYTDSLVKGGKGQHSEGLGRNVYHHRHTGTGDDVIEGVREALKAWYEHQIDYNWRTPLTSSDGAKLFSQIVWKATDLLGIGVGLKNGVTIVTCLYAPGGNVGSADQYKANVLPRY